MLASTIDRSYEEFYELNDPVSNQLFRGSCGVSFAGSWRVSRLEALQRTAVQVRWAMGRARPSDVIWTTAGHPLIVSSRVIDLLGTGGFTGWTLYPVEVFDKHDTPVPGYAGLAITGRCDVPDLSQSEIVLREYPGGWFPRLRGTYVPPGSWDGTDLFMERPDERGNPTLSRYATARLVEAFHRHKIGNLEWTRVTECEVDAAVYTIGSAYRLPPDYDRRIAEAYRRRGVPRPASV